jgi:hypothetical protein
MKRRKKTRSIVHLASINFRTLATLHLRSPHDAKRDAGLARGIG